MRYVIGLLAVLALIGCGQTQEQVNTASTAAAPQPTKILDEASAQAQIAQILRGEPYWISIDPISPLMNESNLDYKEKTYGNGPGVVLYKLVTAGFVTQNTRVASYPAISGEFRGRTHASVAMFRRIRMR